MSSLFDVDCPRTPDGDSQAEPGTPRQQRTKMPPMAPSRPPRISRKGSRGRASSSGSGRSRSTPRRVGGGLEPEEYIVPMRRDAPSSGNAVIGSRTRAFSSSDMVGSGTAGGVPRAPSSGPGRYAPPPPAAPFSGPGGAYTASPRAEVKSNGDGHPRTNSGEWWKEEIVDETEDKDIAMDKHYGVTPFQQQQQQQPHFYGKPTTNPFENENQYFGNPAAARRFNDVNQNDGLDAEQGRNPSTVGNLNNNQVGNSLNASLYDQASQMRHSGYYHTDDFSFNQVHLSDIPISPRSPRDIGTPPQQYGERKAHVRNNFLPRWFSGFSPGKSQNGGPYLPNEMNIAPKGGFSTASSSSEWFSASNKIGFDSSFNPNGVRKRGIAGHWGRLSPAKKVSVGVILVALVCTIMGVSISEAKKNQVARENAALALAMANQPTPSPTSAPTDVPSLTPTDYPTRAPISRSPVAANAGLHGKESDGTPSPTRNPITMRPTTSPEGRPSNSPSVTNSASFAPTSPTAPVACTDSAGEFLNHLGNPKTCEWLNKEFGFSDRKNKNCGTQWPDGTIFPVTDLGSHCQSTCALYNDCGLMNARTNEFEYERPMPVTSELLCEDQEGEFKNHLDVLKDCDWLDNDKPGHTDRKSKNCGWGPNLITELGLNCPQTCIYYNGSGCWDLSDTSSSAGISVRVSAAAASTTEEEEESTDCIDGSGTYKNHKGEEESCDYLHTEFRLERNCGFDRHDITPLGRNCPGRCRDYNACSMPGARR